MTTMLAFAGEHAARAETAAMKRWTECAVTPPPLAASTQCVKEDAAYSVILTHEDRNEVLRLLAGRSAQSVIMSGLVRDNGVQSQHNRGAFYGVRDPLGRLEGVALVGRVSMFETRSGRALRALAERIRTSQGGELVFADEASVDAIWGDFVTPGGQQQQLPARRTRRELWYELRRDSLPPPAAEVAGTAAAAGTTVLRPATADDLESVVRAHAAVTLSECGGGGDPSVADQSGFRERCLRRVAMGRVWVLVERGRLIFKADVAAETPDALYLEGVYVEARERGRGIGRRCLSGLSRILLSRAGSLCLLVEEQNYRARRVYDKCGFQSRGPYQSIFLR